MRVILAGLFFFLALLGPLAPHWGLAQASTQSQVSAVVLEEGDSPEIQESLNDSAIAAAESLNEDITIRTRRGAEFSFSLKPQTKSQSNIYALLTPKQQQSFQNNRIWALQMAASTLDRSEVIIGIINLVNERWKVLTGKIEKPQNPLKVRERGISLIGSILQGFNRYLWSRAPIVAEQNELATHLSAHPAILIGTSKFAVGGIIGLGINLGYNRENGLMSFEIIAEAEHLAEVHSPTAFAGISFRWGISLLSQRDDNDPTAARTGNHFYPYVAPVYLFDSEKEASAGVEFVTIPPVISGLFQFKTRGIEKPLLRVTMSRYHPRSFRVSLGIPTKIKELCSRLFTSR